MKHGDKPKANTAKAKASGKKASAASGKESRAQSGEGSKAPQGASSGKSVSKEAGKKAGPKGSQSAGKESSKAAGNGKPQGQPKAAARGAISSEPGFTNAAVGTAFKRAIKKYPTAFRRLTD